VNFLAHLHLSGADQKIIIGNFIADFVKGRAALAVFEPAVIAGIELHRAIDSFTDAHALVKQSKVRLSATYRHYAGVIVDMFYDHFLAANWPSYHSSPLADFSQLCYRILANHETILPEGAKRMLPYMSKHDWLVSYATIEGINKALSGMARRTPYQSNMEVASLDLVAHYELFQHEFELFYPELQHYCSQWLTEKSIS
jgi:acyl carrier protein phosphodiesterase